jgi:hypothetical protein
VIVPHTEDSTPEDIRQLILQTEAPKDKALLLILLKMSENLNANTALTQKLSDQLDLHVDQFTKHEAKEMQLFFGGRWIIRILLACLFAGQTTLAWYGSKVLTQFEDVQREVQMLKEFKAEHRAHHEQEEKFRGGPSVVGGR